MISLGIDLGTSGVKVLAIDAAQNVLASHTAPLSVSRPHEGWSEQDPADWIAATCTALDALKAGIGPAMQQVRCVGLSGQMHGATLLDDAGKVLRPCILWNDSRSHAEAAALDRAPRFHALSGNIVFPGFTAPKLAWVKAHEPDLFARLDKVLLPKDYLRLWLTGEAVSDMSDASGTAWLDVGARGWSPDLLAACDLSTDHMPGLVEGTELSGRLRPDLADRWGLSRSTVVAGGAGDNAASAIGLGTISEGDGFVSLGTSGVLFAATSAYRPDPASAVHTFCHALPGTWHQMGVILSAASALGWWAGICGVDPSVLVDELGDGLLPPGPVMFHPYLSGERTPHNDPHLRGGFANLSHATSRADLTRAVLEGVAFALRQNRDALRGTGTELARLVATGGGARSSYWLHLLASTLDLPVALPARGDYGAALGAARLGLIAAGAVHSAEACSPPRIDRVFDPDPVLVARIDESFRAFEAAIPPAR